MLQEHGLAFFGIFLISLFIAVYGVVTYPHVSLTKHQECVLITGKEGLCQSE